MGKVCVRVVLVVMEWILLVSWELFIRNVVFGGVLFWLISRVWLLIIVLVVKLLCCSIVLLFRCSS